MASISLPFSFAVVLSPNGHDYWFMGQKCERNRKIYMNFVVKIAKSL